MLAILADVPGHARFDVGGIDGYMKLPISVRDLMLEQLEQWRADEGSPGAKQMEGDGGED